MGRVFLVLGVTVLLFSCSHSKSSNDSSGEKARSEDTPVSVNPVSSEVSSKPLIMEKTEPAPSRQATRPAPAKLLPVTRNDRLMSIGSPISSFPSDFEIGLLFNRDSSGDAISMIRTADTFFRELGEGAFSRNTVDPRWIEHVVRSLRPYLEEKVRISAVRYGMPEVSDDGTGQVRLRIFGANGQAGGLMLFSLRGNRWFVADFQVDLSKLELPVGPRKEPFDPTSAQKRGE